VRALVWWPPIALLLFVIAPDSASWTVTLTGAGLAVLGTTGPALARAIARRGAAPAATIPDPPVPDPLVADRPVPGERSNVHELPTHRPRAA
jgi:hypothetical protein